VFEGKKQYELEAEEAGQLVESLLEEAAEALCDGEGGDLLSRFKEGRDLIDRAERIWEQTCAHAAVDQTTAGKSPTT
jgi:hypothetical protein